MIISYYIDMDGSTYYSDHGKRLVEDCELWGLEHHIVEQPSTGTWTGNTRLKPSFIQKMLEQFQEPVLWLDIDCPLNEYPVIPECDVAAVPKGGNAKHVIAAALYFNYTAKAKDFLQKWIDNCFDPARPDHPLLIQTWNEMDVRYAYLSSTLITIGTSLTPSKYRERKHV